MLEIGTHGLESETIDAINVLNEERRQLLRTPRQRAQDAISRQRLHEIEQQLVQLWQRRRLELSALNRRLRLAEDPIEPQEILHYPVEPWPRRVTHVPRRGKSRAQPA
ncbi:MAG TPA: hypothetical protein VFN57_11825 [Thermomicrobiaceae bacterium]|nr:hypothetical protein [Thermomicrobiaceae bacterium]